VSGWDELREIYQRLRSAGVRTTINTDGTYLLGTTLRREFELLLAHDVLGLDDVPRVIETARQATFIR
jgi:hypothetical protein